MSGPLGAALPRVGRAAAALALAGGLAGCSLVTDFESPDGDRLECFVTLENPDGETVEISSHTSAEFLDRYFFQCIGRTRCPDPAECDFGTVAAAEADWRTWVEVRLEQVAAITDPTDPLFGSDFRTRPGPWCEVPGSLRCEADYALVGRQSCPPPLPAATLPACAPPPPVPACIEVRCAATPCPEIDFGDLPVGETASAAVTVANCGAVEARVQLDESVFPLAERADFAIPAAGNGCRPRDADEAVAGRLLPPAATDPAGSACAFDVVFRPTEPGPHLGRKLFTSSAAAVHRLDLRGNALGGSLRLGGPPDEICFAAAAAAPCAPERAIVATNDGPGAVTVTDVRVEEVEPGSGFELVAPPPLPVTLRPGETLVILVRWCRATTLAPPGATLIIDSDDPANPTFFRRLSTDLPAPCRPGT